MLLSYIRIIDCGIFNNLFTYECRYFFRRSNIYSIIRYNVDIYYHKTPINFLSLGLTKFLLTKAVDSQNLARHYWQDFSI